jgi:hypothetical protein
MVVITPATMHTYTEEILQSVQTLVNKQVSQRQMPALTGLSIHQLREIFIILNVPKKKRGERPRTVENETERCCSDCKKILPVSSFERYDMQYRDGSPRISYSLQCLGCKNAVYPTTITPEIEAEILRLRSLGYGKYPISVKLNIILKHITKYYTAKNITCDPPRPIGGITCIMCGCSEQGSVCPTCDAAYKSSKIKPEKPTLPPKEYKNYANRIDDPIILALAKDITASIGRVLRSAGYNRGRKDVFEHLGYTPQQLFNHIDALLDKSWMTWDNRTTDKRIIWDDNNKSTWTWKIRQKDKTPYVSLEDLNFTKTWTLSNIHPVPLLATPKSNTPPPNKSSRLLSKEDETKIVELKSQGYGSRKLAAIFDVDRKIIQNAFKRLDIQNTPTPTRKPIPSEKECIGCHEIKPIDQYRKRIGQYRDGTERIAYEARCFSCEALQNEERCRYLLETNQTYKLRSVIAFAIWNAIHNVNSDAMALSFLPFTIPEFKVHIESLFEPWMTWKNWGRYKPKAWDDNDQTTWVWNIDHIVPHSTFQYTSFEDQAFKDCWALTNLRPYSAKQNVIDGSKRTRHKQAA